MATSSASSSRGHRRQLHKDIASITLIGLSLLVLLSLISYNPFDFHATAAQRPGSAIRNLIGWTGAAIAESFIQTIGFTAFVIPILSLGLAYRLTKDQQDDPWNRYIAGSILLVGGLVAISSTWFPSLHVAFHTGPEAIHVTFYTGGWTGNVVSGFFIPLLGRIGTTIIMVMVLSIGWVLLTEHPIDQVWDHPVSRLLHAFRWVGSLFLGRYRQRKLKRLESAALEKSTKGSHPPHPTGPAIGQTHVGVTATVKRSKRRTSASARGVQTSSVPTDSPDKFHAGTLPPNEGDKQPWDEYDELENEALKWYEFVTVNRKDEEAYVLPPYQMLSPVSPAKGPSKQELTDTAASITDKLAQFKVSGSIVRVLPGPVVTIYEFSIDPGIKLSRVQGLSEDLALALGVEAVRIDRMPNASSIAIEVPNGVRSIIKLREIIESPAYQSAELPLSLAVGESVLGKPYIVSLIKMPHLLLAGATGSGKSVSINAILSSILLRHYPNDVRLILIDPKMVELKLYNSIPHLIAPVIVDPRKAAAALKWLTHEMTERQRQLAFFNVRNIVQYNHVIQTRRGRRLAEQFGLTEPSPIPFIVVVIDEFADLMVVSSREIEDTIQRLAQMARAVGIHLVVATQRPSVDVITGVIKANFPCRIAFRVASSADSRTILDRAGAERLLGRGDMLFIPPDSYRLVRLHGAYVSEAETEKIVRFWRRQGAPLYSADTFDQILKDTGKRSEVAGPGRDDSAEDPLFDEAVSVVLRSRKTSISYLQRTLRIGYNRSARLIEAMENRGIVSRPDHSGHRKILHSAPDPPTENMDSSPP